MNKLLNILFSVLYYLQKCSTKDYCGAEYCKNSREHTLCKYESSEPASRCYAYEKTILNENMKQNILDKINSRRNKVAAGEIRSLPPAERMLKLEWNNELEMFAQRWADQCVKHTVPDKKDDCRDLGNMAVGQNIATIHGDAPGLTPLALVDVWYMELLHTNTSILSQYLPSSETASSHYDYFTQLMWEETKQVGCGGVKFKERLEGETVKYRTIYRLVCNFSPAGNRLNKSVYSSGQPCSQCPSNWFCDSRYKALCTQTTSSENIFSEKQSNSISPMRSNLLVEHSYQKHITAMTTAGLIGDTDLSDTMLDSDLQSEQEIFTTFDYFSHLYDYTRQTITAYTKPNSCKNIMIVDDFVELLKKKLSNDPMIKDLLTTSKPALNGVSETSFNDDGVAAFIDRVYSKKPPSTIKTAAANDYVNSTFLVDLIEAVIFRNGEKLPASEEFSHYTQPMSSVKPIMIQAELAEVKQNEDFTGHYFFPEDEEESTIVTTESYYDTINMPASDSVLEDLKMSIITKDFLDDILESDTSAERTTSLTVLSPDNINLFKTGHGVMKKFLQNIVEKSQVDKNHAYLKNRDFFEQQSKRKKRSKSLGSRNNLQAECAYKFSTLYQKNVKRQCGFYDFYGKRIQMHYKEVLQKLATDLRKLKLNELYHCTNNCSSLTAFNNMFLSLISIINFVLSYE